ncbi:hypothetical protein GCM10010191_61310 [Actinomadura vinacea]|uniref:Uncharacterized protein n=1 Tax=Actinomadura vinacea TaxID=115336 RepID=A0ABN3JRB3_9ACTN
MHIPGRGTEPPTPHDPPPAGGLSGLTTEQLKEMGYVVWTAPQEKGSWISEGDTSIFMNLLDNGLLGHIDPSGRPSANHAASRWFGAAQQDFAARLNRP